MDTSEKGGEGNSNANMVQKNHPHNKNIKATHNPIKTTTFKKKKTISAKELATRAVKEDTIREIVLTVQITRQRRVMDQQDPRMST